MTTLGDETNLRLLQNSGLLKRHFQYFEFSGRQLHANTLLYNNLIT